MIDKQVIPGDDWGVLGPTNCQLCRNARQSMVFAVLLVFVGVVLARCAYDA